MSVLSIFCDLITKSTAEEFTAYSKEDIPLKIKYRLESKTEYSPEIQRGMQRISDALIGFNHNQKFQCKKLTKVKLRKLAKLTNAAFIHYSGNCALLSNCLIYNLIHRKIALAATNTAPFYEGFSDDRLVEHVLFGKSMTSLREGLETLDEVEKEILEKYKKTGERFYLIFSYNYKVLLFELPGHTFNAIVCLDRQGQPRVQFVDAWKTSDHTPSKETLAKSYSQGEFNISFIPNDGQRK